MKHTLTSRITHLEQLKLNEIAKKEGCSNISVYQKILKKIEEIDKLIELNKELIKGMK